MIRQFELVEKLKEYDPNTDEDMLNRAYVYSMKVHGAQKRASGDPYFSHPLEVAGILADLGLDCFSIVTALLHDTVEDTGTSIDDIEEMFGAEVAKLVDGVTKLSKLELQSEATKQAENFRKLLLAMSSDIRVILVKLADRLHNMRTLHHIKDITRRRRIARETMEIYVPLTERMGIHNLKDELEDLAFANLNPEARDSIANRLKFLKRNREDTVVEIIDKLKSTMDEADLSCEISGREKTPFSIWRKMQKNNITFEQLADVMAFRIVVKSVPECYQTLGIIHNQYLVVPHRFKDYISTPKPNKYQSLHTAIIGPQNHRIEIQIRTQEMHHIAEIGIAAHWKYKQEDGGIAHEGKQYAWLRGLLEILEQAADPEEFLENTKLEMFQDQVFCFTPKGELIGLPRGATAIDFAYAVHSEIGDKTIGAIINKKQMPLRTILKNGDQVEVLTSKKQNPSPTWERFVVTGKARSRIRRFIRSQRREQFCDLGRSLAVKVFKQANVSYSEKVLQSVLKKYKAQSVDDLFAMVGEGLVSAESILSSVYPNHDQQQVVNESILENKEKPKKSPMSIKGLIPGMAVHYAGCCHPLPGDSIVGIIVTGRGVTVHISDCEVITQFNQPERLLDLSWEEEISEKHVGRLQMTFLNQKGSLANVTATVSKHNGNIVNLKITNRATDFWDIYIDVEVESVEHLNNIVAALRTVSIINAVYRD